MAAQPQLVALSIGAAAAGERELESRDPGSVEAQPFPGLELSVTVAVAPQAQFAPGDVLSVDQSVAVAIQVGQGRKAVGGPFAAGQGRLVAEQITAGIDAAIPSVIAHQQGIAWADPAAGLPEPVGIEIEAHARRCQGQGLQAVAVEIQRQRTGEDPDLLQAGVEHRLPGRQLRASGQAMAQRRSADHRHKIVGELLLPLPLLQLRDGGLLAQFGADQDAAQLQQGVLEVGGGFGSLGLHLGPPALQRLEHAAEQHLLGDGTVLHHGLADLQHRLVLGLLMGDELLQHQVADEHGDIADQDDVVVWE